jgi:hypothetical protein
MKKLLNVGVVLTLWRRSKKKRYEWNEQQIMWILAANDQFLPASISTTTSTNSILDSIHAPRSRGRILTENTLFRGFSPVLHCQNHPAAVDGLRFSSGSAAIFAGLEFAGLFHLMCFAGVSPGYASIKSGRILSIRRRRIGPASGDIFPHNMRQENEVKTE